MGGRLVNDALTNLFIPTVLSMVIGECTEVSPWLARRVLRLAAHRLGKPEASERYEAEWTALLDERPGKLLKLFFATWIALRSTWTLRATTVRSPHRGTLRAPRPDRPMPGASNRPGEAGGFAPTGGGLAATAMVTASGPALPVRRPHRGHKCDSTVRSET
jgi:hypothetical protein